MAADPSLSGPKTKQPHSGTAKSPLPATHTRRLSFRRRPRAAEVLPNGVVLPPEAAPHAVDPRAELQTPEAAPAAPHDIEPRAAAETPEAGPAAPHAVDPRAEAQPSEAGVAIPGAGPRGSGKALTGGVTGHEAGGPRAEVRTPGAGVAASNVGEARTEAQALGVGVAVPDAGDDYVVGAGGTAPAGSPAATGARNVAIHPVQDPTPDDERSPLNRPTPDRRDLVTLGVVFASIVLLALNLRSAVTAVPPLLDDIERDLGLTPTVVGLMGALPAFAFAAAGLLGVRILRWTSAERIASILLLVEAAGQLLRPWAGSAPAFLAVTAATLVAMGVGNVVLSALVKAWFPHRIGRVTAAYTTGIAIGTSLPALIAVPVAHSQGWQRSLALWGLLALVAVPGWAVAARTPRALPPMKIAGTTHKIKVWKSRITWGLALLFGCNALNLYAMFTWLPTRLSDAGASDAKAGAMLSLFAGIGILPSLVVPPLVQKLNRSGLITAICVVFFAIGYLGILEAPNTATMLWVSLAGLGGGGFPLVLTLFGLRSATPATAGALSGFAQGIGYLFAAAGPIVVGALHDLTGGWTAPFGFLGASLLLMLVGGWLSASSHTVDDDLRKNLGAKLS